MSNTENNSKGNNQRKILDNPFVGSLVVPVAIVAIGALIIFGVTKMLSTDRGYKDLVREMHSKTFGNRWIAAYELSKVIATKQIPKEEYPWLVENLSDVYSKSVDPRTKRFIVAATGVLQTELSLPLISKALLDKDGEVRFHAVVAIGNMKKITKFDWTNVVGLLDSDDLPLRQAVLLTLGTHAVSQAQAKIQPLLNSEQVAIRYSAATALVAFKDNMAKPILKEILFLNHEKNEIFNLNQVRGLKLNILHAVKKYMWIELSPFIADVAASERDIRVAGVAREVLNQLKK